MHERQHITPAPVRLTIRKEGRAYYAPPPPAAPPPKKRGGGAFVKGSLVVIGAILLTTLASKASDSFNISDALLFAGAGKSTEVLRCPPEMAYVPTSDGGFCIDRYEVSPGVGCPREQPSSEIQTKENIAIVACVPVAVKDAEPWVNVSLAEAMTLCARVGKRLPSAGEWYRAALGTPDTINKKNGCVLGRVGVTNAERTGVHEECVSSFGVYDMVGNVWEWIDANIVDGKFDGRMLPPDGYVAVADADGVPVETSTTSSPIFGDDYFFIDQSGVRGMFRGGFWNLSEKAGIFSINATIQPSFTGTAVGFRCVK